MTLDQGHRENWGKSMCTSFGEECSIHYSHIKQWKAYASWLSSTPGLSLQYVRLNIWIFENCTLFHVFKMKIGGLVCHFSCAIVAHQLRKTCSMKPRTRRKKSRVKPAQRYWLVTDHRVGGCLWVSSKTIRDRLWQHHAKSLRMVFCD